MIVWRDILESLQKVDDKRLDDPADIMLNGDCVQIDVIEIYIPEIDDDRLVAIETKEIENERKK